MTSFFSGYLAQGIGSGSFVENSAVGYARQPVTFTPISGGTVSLAAPVMAGPLTASMLTQRALYDAITGGNLIMWWGVTAFNPLTVGQLDTLKAGTLSQTFPPFRNAGQGSNPVDLPAGSQIGTTSDGNYIYAGVAVEVENGVIYAQASSGSGSGGPGASTPRVITSGTATLNTTDYVVSVNQATPAAITITMPATPTAGYPYVISDYAGVAAADNITIAPNTGQTIRGSAVIATNGGARTLYWLPNLSAYVVAA